MKNSKRISCIVIALMVMVSMMAVPVFAASDGGSFQSAKLTTASTSFKTTSKISIKDAKVQTITYKKKTGKAIKPKPWVKVKGKKLTRGTDYTLSYENNVKAGTATVIIKGKGKYKGTIKRTFKILSPKAYYNKKYAHTWKGYKVVANGQSVLLKDVDMTFKIKLTKSRTAAAYTNGEPDGKGTWGTKKGKLYIYNSDGSVAFTGKISNGKLIISNGEMKFYLKKL